jgi:hypothetical protein
MDGLGILYLTGHFIGTADFDPSPVATSWLTSGTSPYGYQLRDTFVSRLVPSSSALAVTGSSSATSTAAATDAALMLFITDDLLATTKRK